MAKYPGAKQCPLSHNFTATTTAKNCAILHSTGAASTVSQYGWFNTKGANASSHFHVANDGTVEQYIDTAYMSWANTAANPRSVTIETQGDGTKPWTAAQVVAIVKLLAWICATHGISVRQMNSSAKSETGIGWHRLGCDGSFPALPSILAGRNQRGGESWSSARGKVCPGTDRIQQIPGIIAQVKSGDTTTIPAVSKPTTPKDWFDMATENDIRKIVREEVRDALKGIGQTVAAHKIAAFRANDKDPKQINLAEGARTAQRVEKIGRETRALVQSIAQKNGLTGDEIGAIVRDAVAESVVTVDVNVAGKGA